MCAIVGFWNPAQPAAAEELERIALDMALALRHRGPDDEGAWADPQTAIALGHRRLAILDLSAEGHQPMHSADGRYVIVFNGEIYNCGPLREDLKLRGHQFRGHSDTEVMLAAFSEWGIFAALERFVGMFAFALWDRHYRKLHLGRDRAGEKPLYYGWSDGAFLFGSDLPALRAHPQWSGVINRGALALLTRFGYIPGPHCIYEQFLKLPPGCVLTISESDVLSRRNSEPVPYWSAEEAAAYGVADPFPGTLSDARGQLGELLARSIQQQMLADVPLGAFLSGGIDSSLVVALMQAHSLRPIKTFSIGFHQDEFNEAPFAQAVAAQLGTDHTEWYVRDEDLQRVVPQLPGIYSEPLADPSQIPTALLCQLTRARVKVSLSGDAGDELFGGYSVYRKTQRTWWAIQWLPRVTRGRLATGIESFADKALNSRMLNGRARRFACRLSNLADLLPAPNDRSLYRVLMSPNRDPQSWLKDPEELETPYDTGSAWNRLPGMLERMSALDFVTYLPDDILVKVDRAAMAVSLETRVPLLDHRVVEFAARLPASFKQRFGQGKWLLRQLLYQFVPPALVDRPKRGFAAPIAGWLRGSLRSWGEELLDEARLRQGEFFDSRQVREKWQEHIDQKRDWSPGLWHVLMFQAWLEQQGEVRARREVGAALVSSQNRQETGTANVREAHAEHVLPSACQISS
jgi:asparagine synthase (glutamine-hydrolysing)